MNKIPETQVAELRRLARQWLEECDPTRKVAGVHQLLKAWLSCQLALDVDQELNAPQITAGRPENPEIVLPSAVKKRAMNTVEGRATLIHALAHIEFNAINLALDAVWRFSSMPIAYYVDWLKVADEEALHFTLLSDHLQSIGYRYGDFPAHNSLWKMAEKTKSDLLARMALVPRTLEARGLDVTPAIRAKLAQAGDMAAAEILDIILRDEIGHVAIGNRWYAFLCEQSNLEPIATYARLATQYDAPVLRGPFNFPARRAAGFSEDELSALG
jgi:uncharacterized ferritin-like protein (DUF455 family)